jgi:hypothetical protein
MKVKRVLGVALRLGSIVQTVPLIAFPLSRPKWSLLLLAAWLLALSKSHWSRVESRFRYAAGMSPHGFSRQPHARKKSQSSKTRHNEFLVSLAQPS